MKCHLPNYYITFPVWVFILHFFPLCVNDLVIWFQRVILEFIQQFNSVDVFKDPHSVILECRNHESRISTILILISNYFKRKYPAFEVICWFLWAFLQSQGGLRPSD